MIKEQYEKYKDEFGLVHPGYGYGRGRSQNGLRWTSEYMLVLQQNGELTNEDIEEYKKVVRSCYRKVGLLCRSPNDPEQNGPDDVYAVIGTCAALGILDIPKEILEYGRRNLFFYNNTSPYYFNFSAFLGRQIPLIACMKIAAGETITSFDRFALRTSLTLSAGQSGLKNQDGKALAVFQVYCAKKIGLTEEVRSWQAALFKECPNGMRDVYKAFWGNEPAFPTIKYWKDI